MAGLTQNLKVRVADTTLRELEAEAAQTESSVGRIVRQAIHEYLAKRRTAVRKAS